MMTKTQYVLCKIAEEASEIAKVALKAQQFGLWERDGDNPTNVELLQHEFNDLLAMIGILNRVAGLDISASHVMVERKIEKVNHYYQYSVTCNEVAGEEGDRL